MGGTHDKGWRGGLTRRRVLELLGYGGAVVACGAAAQLAVAGGTCTVITGTQEDTLVAAGCTSPVGFCARGTFRGNHGFRGVSAFSATAFDPIPNDPPGRLAVPGESTYTTADGRITVSDVSAFDAQRGTFAGVGRIVGGTGRFAGATGNVFTYGHVTADGSSFTTAFVIELCVPQP
jgi:hypothetical protein